MVAFVLFVIAMVISVVTGYSMVFALLLGLLCFVAVGLRKGFSVRALWEMAWAALRDSFVVIEVMLVIGLITAAWRVSGTITIVVYYGMKVITPPLFLVITFLLSCLLSYALGTSCGVAGTVGVMFMALARSGGVDPVLTAGVIMSGIYFGDRGSPVSSSAHLVAAISNTKIYDNVKLMMRQSLVPLGICLVVYGVLSVKNPISHVDAALLSAFEEEFSLSPWSILPAVVMLLLPLLKVSVIKAMFASIAASVLVAWLVQGVQLAEVLKICVLGYEADGEGLGRILNGGGVVSMLEIVLILILSTSYSGIFSGTQMLNVLQDRLGRACSRIGRFSVMVLVSIALVAIFCNQTIASMLCSDLLKKPYLDGGGTETELAMDIENSVIVLAGLVPWAIACSVPLSFMNVSIAALPYRLYLYVVPIYYWFAKKRWFADAR